MAEWELADLNRAVKTDPAACVAKADARYHDTLDGIVRRLLAEDRRVILLAGPSGSGKTTTANMLADRLGALGHPADVISLDHFYRDDDDPSYPRHPDGTRDLESVDALQVQKIHDTIACLVEGTPCTIPHYDFSCGKSCPNGEKIHVPVGGFAIIEGLHALNPRLIAGLPQERLFRLFISVSSNINENGVRIISGRKLRFLRRLTRDHIFRGASPARTLQMWRGVIAGEDKYLYPFRDTADFAFDTFHEFELGVIKPFTQKTLEGAEEAVLNDPIVRAALDALQKAAPVDPDTVPATSLIREFIAGGIHEHVHR
jgi:uridine kinase